MKLMTPDVTLAFLDGLTRDEFSETRRHLEGLGSEESLQQLMEGYVRGNFSVTTSTRAGEKLYRYVWHVSDDNYLHVNASLYVGRPGQGDDWLWLMGAQMIARQQKCRGLRFESRRKGHLVQALRKGFKVVGVEMEQDFKHGLVPA